MTDEEKKDLINDIIVALKDEGVNIANATIETSLNNIMYFVGYDSNRKPIRLNVTAITDKTTTLSEAIAQEVTRAKAKENELEEELEKVQNRLSTTESVTEVSWGTSSNMNSFTRAGVYNIKGERTNANDNLPISNSNPGHTVSGRLIVLDSSINGTGDSQDKCITQLLTLSNRTGEDGNTYIRTASGASLNSLTWKSWATQQTNVNVGQVVSLDSFIDNGIYSGVFVESGVPSTFVMIVINDYFVGVSPRRVSQFLYKLSKTGEVSYTTRLGVGDGTITWNGWEIINKKELDTTATELLARIQGTSDNSSASNDPFKRYPTNFSSVADAEFMEALNAMHSTVVIDGYEGHWRLYVGEKADVEVKNVCLYYKNDTWVQTIKLPYKWYKSSNQFGVDSDGNYHIHTYYRIHKDGAWGNWIEVEEELKSAIIAEENRAKAEEAAIRKLITDLIGESPETLDSIHEISSWILNDKTGAAALAKQINLLNNSTNDLYEALATVTNSLAETDEDIKSKALQTNTFTIDAHWEDFVNLYMRTLSGETRIEPIPAATTVNAGVMTAEDKREQVKKTPLVNGDIIVGQTREIHSRNGKTVTDSFLVRTTAGSGTIGDGVASLKSVGGNIVKNLVDGTAITNWRKTRPDDDIQYSNGIYTLTRCDADKPSAINWQGKTFDKYLITGHCYYYKCDIKTSRINGKYDIVFGIINGSGAVYKCTYANMQDGWQTLTLKAEVANVSSVYFSYALVDKRTNNEVLHIKDWLLIDLTEMFGAGNEPTKEECDKLFCTMDALPQGLSIANPTEFKATGFNQFNPDNILVNKSIVDGAIVDGDKTLAVVPCLPCKVGVGENNGYCIHGDFGEDIKVYLTPLNPMEVDGELYMHELTKDTTTDTYVPQIKGYMLVEVPTVANLCAHFLWSEDKCERDSYEPYYESVIKLPTISEMPEYGLAGIQTSNTLVCDEIDFKRGVYIKRINKVVFNGTERWQGGGTSSLFCRGIKPMVKLGSKQTINWGGFINYYTGDNVYQLNHEGNTSVFYIRPTRLNITTIDALKKYLAQNNLELYYELETPEEYPLPKIGNNYISSDYGVEQFDSAVPCNVNNLYYMRSLAGETRNFLDRLYDNTDKTDVKEVADYITNGIEGNKPNLALRALYVAAGAEYNDTGADKTKTAPWGETVIHKAGYYYLNGLGDITEEQMMDIYKYSFPMLGATDWTNAFREVNVRTNLFYKQYYSASRIKMLAAAFNANKTIEIINFNNRGAKVVLNDAASWNYAFGSCTKLKRILGVLNINNASSLLGNNCDSLIHVQLYGLNKNLLLFNSSNNIDKESVLYAIQNSTPTSAITITLHPDAYSRLADDADIVAALEAQPLITLVSA